MGKIRVTKKQITESFYNIYECGYCDFIPTIDADFYTCGVYGWNADVYKINYNTVIVTGYRPFGKKRLSKKFIEEFKKGKEEIAASTSDWKCRMQMENDLIEKLLEEEKEIER